MQTIRAAAIGAAVVTLIGCQDMRVEDFSAREPKLDLFQYFEGRSRAWGIFEDRFGRLRREFTVDIVGRRQGAADFVLEEDFVYADGETQRRVWRLRQISPGVYEGEADDVIGTAQGQSSGNALNWRYALALKIGETNWNVDFNDWMFLQPDGVLLNRARVSKWGIGIGEVTLSFQRAAPAKAEMLDAPALKSVAR